MSCLIADLEVFIFRIYGDIQNLRFAYVTAEMLSYVPDAIVDIACRTLCDYFYRPVGQIAYKTGQLAAVCHSEGGETESYALYAAGKDNVFRRHRCYGNR